MDVSGMACFNREDVCSKGKKDLVILRRLSRLG